MSWVVWIIIAIIVDIVYHKMFDVIYFSGKGIVREIIGVIIISGIIYALILFGYAKLTGKVPEKSNSGERESIVYDSDMNTNDDIEVDTGSEESSSSTDEIIYLDSVDPMKIFQNGMTEDEVIEFLGEPDSISNGYYYTYNTVGYNNYLGELTVFLNSNSYNESPVELGSVSWIYECDNIDDALIEAKKLIEYYTAKYGEPNRHYYDEIGSENFDFYVSDNQSLYVSVTDDKTCNFAVGLTIDSNFYFLKDQTDNDENSDINSEGNSDDSSIENNQTGNDAQDGDILTDNTSITEDEEFLFPESDEYEIYESELESLSSWELRIARNEILARHGRRFSDQELQEYFDSCSWYEGTIEPTDFDINILNDVERININIIKNEEDSRN